MITIYWCSDAGLVTEELSNSADGLHPRSFPLQATVPQEVTQQRPSGSDAWIWTLNVNKLCKSFVVRLFIRRLNVFINIWVLSSIQCYNWLSFSFSCYCISQSICNMLNVTFLKLCLCNKQLRLFERWSKGS